MPWHILNTENVKSFLRKIEMIVLMLGRFVSNIFGDTICCCVCVAYTDRKAIPKSHNLCAYNPYCG